MPFTDRPIRNLLLPVATLFVAFWLKPILQRLPAPELPKLQLKSLNGTTLASDSCKIVNNPLGSLKYCEDIVHWKEANLAIASCDAGRPQWNTVIGPLNNPEPRGRLFAYNLAQIGLESQEQIQELELIGFPASQDFHPLGLELLIFDPHSARLFLANHRRDRSVIEVFKVQLGSRGSENAQLSITWERSLAHDLIATPNSLVALDSNTLLITNDHYFNRRAHPFLHALETGLSLRTGSIVEVRFVDRVEETTEASGERVPAGSETVEAWTVINGIPFANGLTLNPSRSTLVVASSTLHTLWYYHQLKPMGSKQRLSFTPVGSRSLSFGPDNIHFDGPERLVVAGHPHGLTLLKFSRNVLEGRPAGSAVAVVSHPSPDTQFLSPYQTQVHELFVDDGDFFASSTSAIVFPRSDGFQSPDSVPANGSEHTMVVTGLYQSGLLQCALS